MNKIFLPLLLLFTLNLGACAHHGHGKHGHGSCCHESGECKMEKEKSAGCCNKEKGECKMHSEEKK